MLKTPAFRISTALAGAIVLLLLSLVSPGRSQFQPDASWSPRLILRVIDASTGKPSAARFTVTVDGTPHEPRWLGPHGLRFASIHVSKRQSEIVTYARGTGPVWVPLKPGAKVVRVAAVKGLDFLPAAAEAAVESESVELTLRLRRWNRLRERGWHAADAHLHYDRVDPGGDRDWFAMMAGDDLSQTQFLVLKGGMVPGIWARQFAYGSTGTTLDRGRTIVAGEEYRDRLQGHLLLFGLREVIFPIMTGVQDSPNNYPAFPDVLDRARELGAIAGAAHGGTLGGSPTVFLDALLGKLDFIEIANWVTGFWPLDNWYRLMNCGYTLPPTAGSDLPNNPQREPWQPFLGGMRMYAKTDGATGAAAWNEAVTRGATFVTNGPSVEFEVGGVGPGGRVCLPPGGGEVTAQIRIRSPHELQRAEIVNNGKVVASSVDRDREGGIHSISFETVLSIGRSSWLAARGEGSGATIPEGSEVVHTAAIQVIVGGQPIWSASDADTLLAHLYGQRDYYARNARYAMADHRREMTQLFERASEELRSRASSRGVAFAEACKED